ncbi:MAG: hypothetical protein IJU82_08510 [Ruminiclostridium sp.]|nr:hypothetical protein [Ruminiclostridium sp.]
MEKTLKDLFDYQRFSGNKKLARIIDEVHGSDMLNELSDDELGFAAGGVSAEIDTDKEKGRKNG